MNLSQLWGQWAFYVNHSLRDLARNGTRTAFALFCIATGVAAVVALRSLAGMIGDELTINLAEINRGDIQIVASNDIDPDYFTRSSQNEIVFSPAGQAALRDWAAEQEVGLQFASNQHAIQILPRLPDGSLGSPVTLIVILVEPENWPFYGVVRTSEPAVLSLEQVFADPGQGVVISRRTALNNQLAIGSEFTVAGNSEPFRVAAYVDDETEGSLVLRNGPAGLIGFIYYPLDRAEDLGLLPLAERAFVQMPLGRNLQALDESLEAEFGEGVARITTEELAEQNAQTADLISDLILVMGLSSILIGGMGIVNTMNVVVSRRMLEIAVLKTLGLKAWRITVLFLVEAALMGIIGSLIGLGSGIVLSYFIRGVGEEVLQTSLSWRAYPEAWYSGVSLGVVITMVFGFLPTLNAGQIRPIGVLRPNDIQLPNAGMTRTLAALLFAMLLFGFTLNTIVSGRLDLPITLMLGLGGFIIGLFGGVILANEGLLDEVGASEDNPLVARSIPVLSLTLGAFALVGLGVVNLFLSPLSLWLVYLLPMVLGGGAYLLLRALAARYAHLPYQAARLARQVLLWGGAAILGGLLGGGLFALWRSVLLILYPREATPPGLNTAIAASLILGLIALFSFRLRARRAASLVGLALIGAAVLSIIGFGLGDVLESLFGGMGFWEPVEEFSTGVIVVQIIVLLLGGIFVAMNGLVWLLARLPSFGSVDVKLAFRNINARRNRTAATMIGLIAGIGALALITLTTSGVTSLLEGQLETNVGGNVVIISRDPDTGLAVKKRLESSLEGVNSFTQYNIMRGRILAINGEDPPIEGLDFGDAADGNSREFGRSEVEEGIGFAFVTIDPSEYQPGFIMEQGDWFTAEDVNERVMVLREPPPGSFLDRLDLDVGDTITWRMFANTRNGGQVEALDITYTIVGIISDQSEESGASDALQAPVGSLPATVSPESVVTVADIQEEHVDAALLEFAQISNAFALEISFLVGLIEQLLNQLIAIPALVALLALVAGVAIIANTVALDTQERRTQIGIMKALGLKGYRVLAQLMFENTFIGLISGLIGVGIGLIVTVLVGVLGDARQVEQTLDLVPALRLIAVSVIVSMVATLLSAWTAARESPMNVLRYE